MHFSVELSGLQRRAETMLCMTGVHQFLNVQGRASSSADPWDQRGDPTIQN